MALSRTCPTRDQISKLYCPTSLVFVNLHFQNFIYRAMFFTCTLFFLFKKLYFLVWNCFFFLVHIVFSSINIACKHVCYFKILPNSSSKIPSLNHLKGHVRQRLESWYWAKKNNSKQIGIFLIIYFKSETKMQRERGIIRRESCPTSDRVRFTISNKKKQKNESRCCL